MAQAPQDEDADSRTKLKGERMEAVFLVLAGLMGALGVILLAASAHAASGVGLDSAGSMLLFHAAAVIGGIAVLGQTWRLAGVIALAALVLGSVLFSGDIAMRAFAGQRLFPYAAPSGGFFLIGGWLAFAIAAAARFFWS